MFGMTLWEVLAGTMPYHDIAVLSTIALTRRLRSCGASQA